MQPRAARSLVAGLVGVLGIVTLVASSGAAAPAIAGGAAPQGPPPTDIWLAELDLGAHPPRIRAPRNVTSRAGYDNQPFFEPEGDGMLYVAERDGQTDIYRLDLAGGAHRQLTETGESEYSPTVTPPGDTISVIRVEADGTQRLWGFDRDGGNARLLFPDVAPVGYQAWNDDAVIVFVLGEPASLQRIDAASGEATWVAADIGRSMHRMPPGQDFTFTQREGEGFAIRILDAATGAVLPLTAALADSTDGDMAWTPDGRILMASGSSLYVLDRFPSDHWVQVADLAEAGIDGITRLAVHPDGVQLALVAAER